MTLIAVLTAGLLCGADPADDGAKELDRLAGTWQAVSIEKDGRPAPEDRVRQTRLVMKGAHFQLKVGDEVVHEGTQKVEAGRNPKEIDGTVDSGPDKGRKSLGIYELTGDRYKVCLSHAGAKRPTEFRTQAGDGRTLIVFKRVKG